MTDRTLTRRLSATTVGAVGAGIIAIGTRFLVRPGAAAAGYGVPAAPREPYLAVKGIRDVGSELMLLTALARDPRTAAATTLAATAIPLGDMVVVLARGGSPRVALGVHGATAVAMVAAAVALRWGTAGQSSSSDDSSESPSDDRSEESELNSSSGTAGPR